MDGNQLQNGNLSYVERYANSISVKKEFLKTNWKNLSQEERIKKSAEVIYLVNALKNGRPTIENPPEFYKKDIENTIAGKYSAKQSNHMKKIEGEIKNLTEYFNLDPSRPLPERLYQHAFAPENVKDEDIVAERNDLIHEGLISPYSEEAFEHPTPELLVKVKDDIRLNLNRDSLKSGIDKYIDKRQDKNELGIILNDAGLSVNLLDIQADLLIYLMGRKQNPISLEQAMNLTPQSPEFEQYFNDFIAFAKNHSTKDKNTRQKNLNETLDLFGRCAKVIGEYEIPDIDYSDPVKVLEHEKEFSFLDTFVTRFRREHDTILRNQIALSTNYPGGHEKAIKDREPVEKLKAFTESYRIGYNVTCNELSQDLDGTLQYAAVGRCVFGKEANAAFKGKKVKDVVTDGSVKYFFSKDYYQGIQNVTDNEDLFSQEEVMDYLKTGNPQFAEKVSQIEAKEVAKIRKEKNSIQSEKTKDALVAVSKVNGLKDALSVVFKPDKPAEAIYNDLANPNRLAVQEAGLKLMDKLFANKGQREYLINPYKDPYSLIRIDGKTLDELYGLKYIAYTNPSDRQMLYRSELINQIVNGKHEITVDTFMLDENGKVVEGKPVTLVHSMTDTLRARNAFKSIDGIKNSVNEFRRTLNTNDPVYLIAKDLEDAADIDSNEANYAALEQKVQAFLAAANTDDKKAIADMVREYFEIVKANAAAAGFIPGPNEDVKDYGFEKIKDRLNLELKLREGKELDLSDGPQVYDGEIAFLNGRHEFNGIFTDDQYPKVNQLLRIDEQNQLYVNDATVAGCLITNNPQFPAGTITAAPSRIHALFCAWAMAEKGLTVEEASRLSDSPVIDKAGNITNLAQINKNNELREEFIRFINQYPMLQKENAPEADKITNLTKWAEVFKKAKLQVEKYVLPDIDYTDPKQVEAHWQVFGMLDNLSVNSVQETDRMMNQYGVGQTLTAKCFGGEKEFWSLKQFYFGLQENFGKLFYSAHRHITNPRMSLNYMTVATRVTTDYFANKFFTPFKGKPIKEYLNNMYSKSELICLTKDYINSSFAEMDPNVQPLIPMEIAVSKLFGKNVKAFEAKAEEGFNRKYNELQANAPLSTQRSFGIEIVGGCISPMRELLIESKDDVESMRELNRAVFEMNAGNIVSVQDHINHIITKCTINGYYGNVMHLLGLNRSDLFLIDGKAPSKLWSEKYKNVADENERELLYRLEVIKAIAKGTANVQMRRFDFNREGFHEVEPENIAFGKEITDKMYDSLAAYKVKRDDMLSRLLADKEMLRNTQSNMSANFGKADEEGSTEYKNYTKALQNAIDVLQRDANGEDVSPTEIRNKLTALENVAAEYHRTHVGIIGPRTDRGITRRECSAKHKSDLVYEFDSMRQGFANNLIISNSATSKAKDASFATIVNTMNKPVYRNALGHIDINDPKYLNEYVKAELGAKLKELKDRLSKENPNKVLKPEEKLAREYLLGYFEARVNPDARDAEPSYSIDDLRKIENFDDEVYNLSVNPLFIRKMKENPDKCIREFSSVEARGKNVKDMYSAELRELVRTSGTALKAVFDLTKESQDTPEGLLNTLDDTIRNADENDPDEAQILANAKNRLEHYYDNLASVTVRLLLNSKRLETQILREQVADDPNKYQDLVNAAKAYFIGKRVLEGRNIEKFGDKFADNSLAEDLLKHLTKREKDLLKAETDQKTRVLDETERSFAFLFDPNRERILTREEFNRIDEKLHFSDSFRHNHKINEASKLLNKKFPPAPIREDVVQTTVSPEDGRKVEVTFKGMLKVEALNAVNAFEKCNLVSDRLTSVLTVFMYYVMAKKGLDPLQAQRICETVPEYNGDGELINKEEFELSEEYRNEFIRFCRQNAVAREDATAEYIESGIREWAKIYKAGHEKIMNFKIPEANYRNREEALDAMDQFNLISRLTVDADQEFSRIFTSQYRINAMNIAKDELGGEEEYLRIKHSLDASFSNINDYVNAYGLNNPAFADPQFFIGHPIRKIRKEITKMAVSNINSEKVLNHFSGKTLAEITRTAGTKALYQRKLANELHVNFADSFEDSQFADEAIRYQLGKGEEFIKKATPTMESTLAEVKDYVLFNQRSTQNMYKDNVELDAALLKLADVPDDDFESMKQFMEGEMTIGNETMSGEAFVAKRLCGVTGIFDAYKMQICTVLGIEASETVLFDGKKPSEIWGRKYEHIENPSLKEKYYRAEILKEIALGRKEFSMRNFSVTSDDRLIEQPPQFLLPKREKQLELIENARIYEAGSKDITNDLNTLKNRLAATQTNQDANFDGKTKEFNTIYYSHMASRLGDLIYMFENDKKKIFDKELFIKKFDELLHAAREYERTHSGWFSGRWSDEGKERLAVSRDLQKLIPELKERYLRLREGFASNMPCSQLGNFADSSFGQISRSVRQMEKGLRFVRTPEYYKQKYIEREMALEIEKARNRDLPAGPTIRARREKARNYILHKYEQAAQNGTADFKDLKSIRNIDARINELAGNPLFIMMEENYHDYTYENWERIETITPDDSLPYRNELDRILEEYGSLLAFATGMPKLSDDMSTPEERQRELISRLRNADNNDLAENLYKIVTYQMLSGGSVYGGILLQCCKLNEKNIRNMEGIIREKLNTNTAHYLFDNEIQNMSDAEIADNIRRFDSGEISNDLSEAFTDSAAEFIKKQYQKKPPVLHEPVVQVPPVANIPEVPDPEENNGLNPVDFNKVVKVDVDLAKFKKSAVEDPVAEAREKLAAMGKGSMKDNDVWAEKVNAFMDILIPNAIELRGGLKKGETKVTVKEEMFGTHEKRAKLLELLEKHDGNELLAMIDNGSIQNEFAVNKNIALNKQENKPELNKPEGNHEPSKHEEIKAPGK